MKKPPPLSPWIEALLAPHRRVLPLAPSVEARAIARAAAESPEALAVRPPVRRWWVLAAAACLVVAFGAGAGAYAARAWGGWPASRSSARVAPVATPSRLPVGAPIKLEAEAPAIVVPPGPPPSTRVVRRASAPALPTSAELQLLRLARQDLTRGDFAGALAAVAEHARRFRNGSLVEEREALRVKSLAGLGRHDDAQRAAARFQARFPHSVFLSTFERMVEPQR